MTHKEAIKNLTELQIRLINDNSEEAIEYNKKIYDTLAYFITQTIPSSVIEKIKAELHALWDNEPCVTEHGCDKEVYDIIDIAVKECTHE